MSTQFLAAHVAPPTSLCNTYSQSCPLAGYNQQQALYVTVSKQTRMCYLGQAKNTLVQVLG